MISTLTLLFLLGAPTLEPIGDGGARRLIVKNPNVYPLSVAIGHDDATRALEIEGYGEATLHLQCVDRGAPLTLTLQADKTQTFDPPRLAFPDGPPALWLTSARQGRGALAALIAPHAPGVHLRHLSLSASPADFAALRFAPLLLISLADLERLTPARREALRGAVASGATLVLTAGSVEGHAASLAGWSPATLGETARPGPEVLSAISHASARRALIANGATTRIIADGAPLVVESRLGLGRVRVVGLSFSDLGAGVVAEALFTPVDGIGPALRWVAAASLPQAPKRLFSGAVFIALGLIPILALIARRWPRLSLPLIVAWGVFSLLIPATPPPLQLDALRVLEIPFAADKALFIAAADLSLRRSGAHRLPSTLEAVSLEDLSQRGCLIKGAGAADWLFEGEVGARRRLTLFAIDAATGEGAPSDEQLAGPWGAEVGALRIGGAAPQLLSLTPRKITHRLLSLPPLTGSARPLAPSEAPL
ncbi:hypothetical protein KKF91_04310 [Myxococcota bacterium]|nr:hypothetical protein [Myxococcota bacterium]MBU1429769.1 hypothetical protein [Myxococcota bacterium]MBU1898717.1 hypothetical protein [Myxococcota bacterium]